MEKKKKESSKLFSNFIRRHQLWVLFGLASGRQATNSTSAAPHGVGSPLSTYVPDLSLPALRKLLKNQSSPLKSQGKMLICCSTVLCPPTHPLQRQGYALHLDPRWQLPPTWLLLLWPTPVPGSLLDSWPTPTPSSRLATCRIPDLCFFCPALYLPSTTTVSTGASRRPSA